MRLHRRARKADSEERILPLINVVFLLLIFFMLAGHLAQTDLFKVAPPVSEGAGEGAGAGAEGAAAESEEAQEIVLLLAADGRLALNGSYVEPADLKAAVAARLAAQPGLPVTLKADGAAEALDVVAVMESLRDAGVGDLQLLAQPPQAQPRLSQPPLSQPPGSQSGEVMP